jgi:hypothetical protein
MAADHDNRWCKNYAAAQSTFPNAHAFHFH